MNYHRIFDGMIIDGHKVDTAPLKETGKVIINGEEWDADDLISDEDKKNLFEEDMLRTKDDILSDIDYLLKEIERTKDNDLKHSPAYYKRYEDLINRFKETVKKCVFPKKLEDWWYYDYEVEETGITLRLNHTDSPDLNNEGFFDFIFIDTSFDLLKVETKLLTVDQYAKENEVTPTTVRQWIRRGKLRTAVKQGSEWRIPDLAEIRERGYKLVQYEWKEFLTGFPKEYDFINDYSLITIQQHEEHKDMFRVSFSRKQRDVDAETKEININQKEKEKLELLLISNPFVKAIDSTIVTRG